MAFAAESFLNKKSVSDPRYTRWYATTIEVRGENLNYTWYPLHECTDDELLNFYAADSSKTADKMAQLQSS